MRASAGVSTQPSLITTSDVTCGLSRGSSSRFFLYVSSSNVCGGLNLSVFLTSSPLYAASSLSATTMMPRPNSGADVSFTCSPCILTLSSMFVLGEVVT